jgi:hypothetical protein
MELSDKLVLMELKNCKYRCKSVCVYYFFFLPSLVGFLTVNRQELVSVSILLAPVGWFLTVDRQEQYP